MQASKLARLKRQISRNSRNSPMPSGADDRPERKPPQARTRRDGGGKRELGKQSDALDAYLA